MRSAFPWLAKSLVVCLLAVAAGCRDQGRGKSASPQDNPQTGFCVYYERASFIPASPTRPFFDIVAGDKTVFRFGHWWTHGSEGSGDAYTFEVESGGTGFAFDSSDFADIHLVREGDSPQRRSVQHAPPGRIEGVRTSDSTWVLREWLSQDYYEWRRRESYHSFHPDLSRGLTRTCSRKHDPIKPYH